MNGLRRLRSPIRWFGGKGHMTAKLLPYLTAWPHHRYVEVFGGGASVLFAKRPAEVDVYNDLDEGLADFFRVLADPRAFGRFHRRVGLLPYSRAIYNDCRQHWADSGDRVERAAAWFVVARQSFSGKFAEGWSTTVTKSCRGMAAEVSKWLSTIDGLPQVHARLRRVQIEQQDWRVILERYDTPETLFYLDPPYVHGTRRSGGYAHELVDDDHRELVFKLAAIRGQACLSGYESPLYAPLLRGGWKRVSWQLSCSVAGGTRASGLQGPNSLRTKQPRTEILWYSPGIAAALKAIRRTA